MGELDSDQTEERARGNEQKHVEGKGAGQMGNTAKERPWRGERKMKIEGSRR